MEDPNFAEDPFSRFTAARRQHPWLAQSSFGYVITEYAAMKDLLGMDDKLRVAQRAWLAWRDATCALESWETPNRFAHSIYSGQLAPCIDSETVARIRWLRRTYRLRG